MGQDAIPFGSSLRASSLERSGANAGAETANRPPADSLRLSMREGRLAVCSLGDVYIHPSPTVNFPEAMESAIQRVDHSGCGEEKTWECVM
jgi:hypothetical protein